MSYGSSEIKVQIVYICDEKLHNIVEKISQIRHGGSTDIVYDEGLFICKYHESNLNMWELKFRSERNELKSFYIYDRMSGNIAENILKMYFSYLKKILYTEDPFTYNRWGLNLSSDGLNIRHLFNTNDYCSFEKCFQQWVDNFGLTIHVSHVGIINKVDDNYYLGKYASLLSIDNAMVSGLDDENLKIFEDLKKELDDTVRSMLKTQHNKIMGISSTVKSARKNL